MKIVNVVCAPGRTGFFFDDQKAIKSGAKSDGAAYIGQPVTSGFKSIRQAGESISVMLVLEDGQIAWGDCAAVQYSGAGGRDPLFLAEDFIPALPFAPPASKNAPMLAAIPIQIVDTSHLMYCIVSVWLPAWEHSFLPAVPKEREWLCQTLKS